MTVEWLSQPLNSRVVMHLAPDSLYLPSLQPAVQGYDCDLPDILSPISNSHMPLFCFAESCTGLFQGN